MKVLYCAFVLGVIVTLFMIDSQTVRAEVNVNVGCPSLRRSTPMIYVQRRQFLPTQGEETYYLVSLTDYIIGVVEGEIFPTAGNDPDKPADWMDATLKAQAVLARTYAYRFCGDQPITDKNRNPVIDPVTGQQAIGTNDSQQAYRPQVDVNYEYLRSFVEQGLYLAPSSNFNQPIEALYKSYTHGPDGWTLNANPTGPLKGIFDPISLVGGHGSLGQALEGLGQNSADHWARGDSHGVRFPQWDYTKILAHYYTNVQLVAPSEIGYWGPYRWNLLKLEPSSYAEIYYVGKPKSLTLRLQNTGSNTWETGTTLRYRWRRQSSAGLYVTGWSSIGAIAPRNPGEDILLSPFNVIPPMTCIAMHRVVVMRSNGIYFVLVEHRLRIKAG